MDQDTPSYLNSEGVNNSLSSDPGTLWAIAQGLPEPESRQRESRPRLAVSSSSSEAGNIDNFSNNVRPNFTDLTSPLPEPSSFQGCQHLETESPHIIIIDQTDNHSSEQKKLMKYCSARITRNRKQEKEIDNRAPDFVGASSNVFLMKDNFGEKYIEKRINDLFKASEVICMNSLHQANVPKVKEVVLLPGKEVWIRMDLIQGDVVSVIQDRLYQQGNEDLLALFALMVLRCVLPDVDTMHKAEWTHGDIQGFNVMLGQEGNEIKTTLIDFETAKTAKCEENISKDMKDVLEFFKSMYENTPNTFKIKPDHDLRLRDIEESFNEVIRGTKDLDEFIELLNSTVEELIQEEGDSIEQRLLQCLFADVPPVVQPVDQATDQEIDIAVTYRQNE